jgi:hypothetical protein
MVILKYFYLKKLAANTPGPAWTMIAGGRSQIWISLRFKYDEKEFLSSIASSIASASKIAR